MWRARVLYAIRVREIMNIIFGYFVYYMLCVWLQVSVVSWAICEQPGHLETQASRQRTAHISEYLSFVVFDRSLEPAETRLGKMVYYIRVLAD